MATATVTGTITESTQESDIVAGGKTIVITLTGDTWISTPRVFADDGSEVWKDDGSEIWEDT